MKRRGVTLVELLIAGLLAVTLLGVSLGALMALQRAGQHQVEATARNLTMLSVAQLLRAELAGASPASGDFTSLGPHTFRYRATRGSGVACGLAPEGVLVASASLRALRLPAAGRDSLLWLQRGPGGLQWASAPVTAAPRTAACPGDGAAAMLIPASVAAPGAVVTPGPAVIVELMECRGYQSGTDWWLGLRSVATGEATQPVAGPFVPRGVSFEYLDEQGAVVADPAAVRRVRVLLQALASQSTGSGGAARSLAPGAADSLKIEIPLRGDWP